MGGGRSASCPAVVATNDPMNDTMTPNHPKPFGQTWTARAVHGIRLTMANANPSGNPPPAACLGNNPPTGELYLCPRFSHGGGGRGHPSVSITPPPLPWAQVVAKGGRVWPMVMAAPKVHVVIRAFFSFALLLFLPGTMLSCTPWRSFEGTYVGVPCPPWPSAPPKGPTSTGKGVGSHVSTSFPQTCD